MERIRRFYLLSFFIAVIFSLLSSSDTVTGSTITVKPGRFNHFTFSVLSSPIAGESFAVRLQAYDIYNNLITDFSETGRDFEVKVSGSAQVDPRVLRAASFQGGAALINIKDRKAEAINLSISEIGGTLPVLAKDISVRPNRPDHFTLQVPTQVKIGESFDVRVVAMDAFENIITDDPALGKDLKISIGGSGGLRAFDSRVLNFSAGTATARFFSDKIGEVEIEIYDSTSGSRGKSSPIKIIHAGLNSFSVQASKEGVAGEPVEVLITALDSYGNPVTNYDATGDGVILSSTGRGKIRPDRIPPSEFKNGHAAARATYEVAENIEVVVREVNKSESGKSGTVKIRPASPDHFVVTTPEMALAGQNFKIKLETYDKFNNLVVDYNLSGRDVYLSSTGSGILSPSIVPPSSFVNGVAVIDAIYDKAESFSITARVGMKKETVKEIKEKKVEPEIKRTVEKEAKPPVQGVKEKVKLETKPKTRVKKEVAKKTEPAKPEMRKAELKKEALRKEGESISYEVSDIGIVESKKRAILVIASNGPLEHKASLVTKDGKKWLNIKVSPAIRKMEKMKRLKSSFVGDVILEEEGKVLSISLELLPENVTYKTKSAKNSIVVTFTIK